jgi:phosphate uptake regulator
MEGRKLQLAGGSTYLVSLPRRWVLNAGLKPGDTLFVETESDGSVSVRRNSSDKPITRRKVFEERGEESREHLIRKLIGAYISGFGLIEVRFTPDRGPFARRVAREFCRLVIGPEVIEENRNALVIQDLSDPLEVSSPKCLRRMHQVVRAMLADAVLALKTSDSGLAHDVARRDQDVDRLYWMVAKRYHLANSHSTSTVDDAASIGIHSHRLVAKLLERTGDHAVRLASTFATISEGKGLDLKLMRDLEEANSNGVAILDKAFSSLVSGNIENANEAIDACSHHQKLIDALSHRVATRKGEKLLALGTVVDSLGRTASYSAEIAEQAIDLAVLTDAPSN